jgi:hypothetical protein
VNRVECEGTVIEDEEDTCMKHNVPCDGCLLPAACVLVEEIIGVLYGNLKELVEVRSIWLTF